MLQILKIAGLQKSKKNFPREMKIKHPYELTYFSSWDTFSDRKTLENLLISKEPCTSV